MGGGGGGGGGGNLKVLMEPKRNARDGFQYGSPSHRCGIEGRGRERLGTLHMIIPPT